MPNAGTTNAAARRSYKTLTFQIMAVRVGLKLLRRARPPTSCARSGGSPTRPASTTAGTSTTSPRLGDDPSADVFEAWTLLGAMAEATARVRIGCMVTGNTYRHPGVLAKMAVTVDHLSGGRLEFGLGAAWAELEHTMLDLEFGTAGQRIARLEEACRVIKPLWTRGAERLRGRPYRSRARSRTRSRCRGRTRRSGSAAPASGRRCGSSPSTPTSGTRRRRRGRGCTALRRARQALRGRRSRPGGDPPLGAARLHGDVDDLLARCAGYVGAGFEDLVVYLAPGGRRGRRHGRRRGAAAAPATRVEPWLQSAGRGRLAQLVRAPL